MSENMPTRQAGKLQRKLFRCRAMARVCAFSIQLGLRAPLLCVVCTFCRFPGCHCSEVSVGIHHGLRGFFCAAGSSFIWPIKFGAPVSKYRGEGNMNLALSNGSVLRSSLWCSVM